MGAQGLVLLTSTDLLFVHFVTGRPEPLIGFAVKFQIALAVQVGPSDTLKRLDRLRRCTPPTAIGYC